MQDLSDATDGSEPVPVVAVLPLDGVPLEDVPVVVGGYAVSWIIASHMRFALLVTHTTFSPSPLGLLGTV